MKSRIFRLVLAVALIVLLIFVPPIELYRRVVWRIDFGTWSGTDEPPRVDFCGNRFFVGNETMTLSQVKTDALRNQESNKRGTMNGLHVIDRTPGGSPILADTLKHSKDGELCTYVLYVNVHGQRYMEYVTGAGG